MEIHEENAEQTGGACEEKMGQPAGGSRDYPMGIKRWCVFVYEQLSGLSPNVVPLSKNNTLVVQSC